MATPPIGHGEASKLIEEALLYFRPNILYRSFEIQNPQDRTMAYLFLVIAECLGKLGAGGGPTMEAGRRLLIAHVQQVGMAFPLPGEAGFPLNAHFPAPSNRQESEQLRQYLFELRVELVNRLVEELYELSKEQPDKWWMSFQKRRFMNVALCNM